MSDFEGGDSPIQLIYKGVTFKFQAEQDWDTAFSIIGKKAQVYAAVEMDEEYDQDEPYSYVAEWLGVRGVEMRNTGYEKLQNALDALIEMEADAEYDPEDESSESNEDIE